MRTQSVKTASRPAKGAKRTSKKPLKASRAASGKAAKTSSSKAKAAVAARSTRASISSKIAGSSDQVIIRTQSPPVQPVSALDVVRRLHKYQVGEVVYFTSPSFGRAAASGSYTVVKLLPTEGDDHQYRIKSSGEAFERVAKESQLDRA